MLTSDRAVAKPIEFFQDRVMVDPKTNCWVWMFARTRKGYGRYFHNKRAHRGAWEAVNGPIPEGMFVCHKCDNPPCCNPEHLFLGNHEDNVQDKVSKGRQAFQRGTLNGRSVLSEHDVSIIKLLSGLGVRKHLLATLYDVSEGAVSDIRGQRCWAHVNALEMP